MLNIGRVQQLKNVSINLTSLPFQTFHELRQDVADELKVWEKWALIMIKDA